MAGARQKHPDALAYKGSGRYVPLAPVTLGWQGRIPTLPHGVRPEVKRAWRDLFSSQLSGVFKPTDVPTLRRWAWWFNQWLRAADEVAQNEIAPPGLMHMPVLNPTIRYLKTCEASLRELEKAFGMDALARLRLGITLADGQAKAAALKSPGIPREA